MTFPNEIDFEAGVHSLVNVLRPIVVDPVWVVDDVPDLEELAMLPDVNPLDIKVDDKTGPDGELQFEFSSYFNRMVPFSKDATSGAGGRQPWRGGFGGKIVLECSAVQATEEIRANDLWPVVNADTTSIQEEQLGLTAIRIGNAIMDARIRDRTDHVLRPMIENNWLSWDGVTLISEDHLHPDSTLFSNQLKAGAAVKHADPTDLVPVRVDEDKPTVEELYTELRFAMSHNSAIRTHLVRFHKMQIAWKITIVVKDQYTLRKFQDLNMIARAKFASVDQAEMETNPFFGNLEIVRDSNQTYPVGEERHYFVLPRSDQFVRKTGEEPSNRLGLRTWRPRPRALVFAAVREANEMDFKYDPWGRPTSAYIGIWEMWCVGAGFGEELIRWDPVSV